MGEESRNKNTSEQSKGSENTVLDQESVKSGANASNKQVGATEKRKPPAAGMGRVKGSLNKMTKTAKEAIALAAEKLGGPDRLVEWVQEDPLNERVFWGTIYPKLLPLQVSGEGGAALQIQIVRFSDGDSKTSE